MHARPSTQDASGIFYVGKGSARRAKSFSKATGNRHYRHVVEKHGKENILVGTMECSSDAIACDLERGLIKCLRRIGVKLTNMTDGGEGAPGLAHSEENRRKKSAASLKLWSNPEYKHRLSETQKIAQANPAAFTEKKRASSLVNIQKAKEAQRDPAVKELSRLKNSIHSKSLWADPAFRERESKKRKESWTPDRKAGMSLQTKGRVRVNNGVEELNVFPGEALSLINQGWRYGRKPRATN